MKMIVALIKPEQLPAVKQALFDAEIRHMTATSVMGTAPRTEQQMFRGVKKEVSLLKRVRLELAVNDANLERAHGGHLARGHGERWVGEGFRHRAGRRHDRLDRGARHPRALLRNPNGQATDQPEGYRPGSSKTTRSSSWI